MCEKITLNARLLETLSIHEKMDVLFKSEPLSGRKPSQMLVNILAYCPSGMEQSIMFQYMFLLVTLRTCWSSRSLAARADKLWGAIDKQQFHDLVANVEVAEEQPVAQIAAVQKKEPRKKKELPWKKSGGHWTAACKQAASGPGSGGLTHSEQARVGSGCVLLPFGPMGPGSASVRPPGAT
jgi:hypothetical protein